MALTNHSALDARKERSPLQAANNSRAQLNRFFIFALAIALMANPFAALPSPQSIAITGAKSPPAGAAQLAGGETNRGSLPALASFSASVADGNGSRVAGVYVPGVLALRVLQQPAGNPGHVTGQPDSVSQFTLAARQGTLGLLAHNYLAGEQFFALSPGQSVVIIRADGTRERFRVDAVRRYQALSPWSPLSAFVDLDNPGNRITAQSLFNALYGAPDQVVFQTCIEKDGNSVWGRLFVLATRLDGVDLANKWGRLEAFLIKPIEVQSL